MWVNFKLQLAWKVSVLRRAIHKVYMLRWELLRKRGLNLTS